MLFRKLIQSIRKLTEGIHLLADSNIVLSRSNERLSREISDLRESLNVEFPETTEEIPNLWPQIQKRIEEIESNRENSPTQVEPPTAKVSYQGELDTVSEQEREIVREYLQSRGISAPTKEDYVKNGLEELAEDE